MHNHCRKITITFFAFLALGVALPSNGRAQSDKAVSLQTGPWQMVKIQSMDDREWHPADGEIHTLRFQEDGTLQIQADCNSGLADWNSEGPSQLLLGTIAGTRADCGPGSLHDRFLRELTFVRSYIFRDDRLFLATMADGSIIEFRAASENGPSFDCTAASGSVQEAICDNAELAAFDRRLDKLYKKALATFPSAELPTLRAYQRGWIKGRDDCWKANSMLQCAIDEYQHRITELQIKVADTMVPEAVAFSCNDDNAVSIYFYNETELPAAVINRHPDQALLFRVESASGAKYQGGNITFWQKGDSAVVEWNGLEIMCNLG